VARLVYKDAFFMAIFQSHRCCSFCEKDTAPLTFFHYFFFGVVDRFDD